MRQRQCSCGYVFPIKAKKRKKIERILNQQKSQSIRSTAGKMLEPEQETLSVVHVQKN